MRRAGFSLLLLASCAAPITPPASEVAEVVIGPSPSSAPSSSATVHAERQLPPTRIGAYRVGDRIEVEWNGRFYPAQVIDVVGSDRYRIHYEGYGPEWDEIVTPSRIQARRHSTP